MLSQSLLPFCVSVVDAWMWVLLINGILIMILGGKSIVLFLYLLVSVCFFYYLCMYKVLCLLVLMFPTFMIRLLYLLIYLS